MEARRAVDLWGSRRVRTGLAVGAAMTVAVLIRAVGAPSATGVSVRIEADTGIVSVCDEAADGSPVYLESDMSDGAGIGRLVNTGGSGSCLEAVLADHGGFGGPADRQVRACVDAWLWPDPCRRATLANPSHGR